MPTPKSKVFILTLANGEEVRIRAGNYDYVNQGDGMMTVWFKSQKDSGNDSTAHINFVVRVIPQDMLVSSFEDETILPDLAADDPEGADFLKDAFFNDAEKTPFTPRERESVTQFLKAAEERIVDEFKPNAEQVADIHQKVDYLSRKVANLDKFNWKRLFISTLVGIAVDLCFGTLIPHRLLEIFKDVSEEVLSHFGAKRLK